MNVLSTFDGMSCGRIALERAGIPVTNYFASEVDKYAIKVSKANWPDIEHVGDVTRIAAWMFPKIDLLIGGSPCQGFSFAGKQLNFNDPRSKLFFEFARLWEEVKAANPKAYFFLENVVMKKEYRDIISNILGVQPILINSALVSAQTRKRLYWTNIPYLGPPRDRGIFISDILLTEIDVKYVHTPETVAYMCREVTGGRNHWEFNRHNDKARGITGAISKSAPYNVLIDRLVRKGCENIQVNPSKKAGGKQPHNQDRIYDAKGKAVALTAVYAGRTNILHLRENTKKGFTEILPGQCFDNTFPKSLTRRGRKMAEKVNCLTASKFDYNEYLGDAVVRRLTPVECERLQTVSDDYTDHVSDSQRYKMLGNGWNVDTITHLFLPLNPDYAFHEL